MQIKRTHAFLMAAAFLSVVASTHSFAASTAEEVFAKLDTSKGVPLVTKSVDDRDVVLFMGRDLGVEVTKDQVGLLGQNYTMVGNVGKARACVVFLEDETTSKNKFIEDREGHKYVILDRELYDFHLAAHETAHCMNHNYGSDISQIHEMLKSQEFKAYGNQVRALDEAIREAYADLMSTLVGASKTGDWSVLSEVVMPLRATGFNPNHATSTIVFEMVKDLDPKQLQGKPISDIYEAGSLLFKKNFFKDGAMDLKSTGVSTILQDWNTSASEQIFFLEKSRAPNTAKLVQYYTAHKDFAEMVIGSEKANEHRAAFTYNALKRHAITQQMGSVKRNRDSFDKSSEATGLVNALKAAMGGVNTVYRESTHRYTGGSFDRKQIDKAVEKLSEMNGDNVVYGRAVVYEGLKKKESAGKDIASNSL